MQILLPPSEGKTPPDEGPPVDPAGFAVDVSGRDEVLNALVKLCIDAPDSAATTLKLGKSQADLVAVNAALPTAPTAPAATVYTGVMFDALGLSRLPDAARRRADRSLLIFSGLWGVVRPDDAIPSYRCSAGVKLPDLSSKGTTTVARFWASRLTSALNDLVDDGFVIDLRSSAYAAMWRPAASVAIRVLHERQVDGELVRSVVSHFNKATKGRLAATLLTENVQCKNSDELATALKDLGYRVETHGDVIDVVVSEL